VTVDEVYSGILHIYVAFDWGDEIDLERARQLIPAEPHALPRKARTPSSIGYQPPPLRFSLPNVELPLREIVSSAAEVDVTVFDFGAVSASFHVPFELSASSLTVLAASLAQPAEILERIRKGLWPIFERLRGSIQNPAWHDLSEEYFVFQLKPAPNTKPEVLLEVHCEWLARLIRLEAGPLSKSEVTEALRQRLTYTPDDLLVVDWAAAVLVDADCNDTLDVIAFANLQLLEFRYIDARLDTRLGETYHLIQRFARRWLPFWRTHARQLRAIGALNADVNIMLERSANALNLVGDPYLARAFHVLSMRFHLDEWGQGIRRSIGVLEGIYKVVSDQSATYRAELLELTIVLLILFEIVMAFWR
jgi:hypothetical protein